MPTYDYRCPNGHDFEHFYRKISDATAELACPTCGAIATRRVSGGAGLVFKGSGFYLTDYGKNAHRKPGPDASSAGGDAKGESGSDTKAPAKTDAARAEAGGTKSEGSASSASSAKPESAKGADAKPSSGKPKGGDAT
jgi:putative FmdB family regulatory protein